MKALLESSINWSKINEKPKGNYMYYVRQATMEEDTNTLFLEVCLNFSASGDDEKRFENLLFSELSQVSRVVVKLHHVKKLPEEADLLRVCSQAKIRQDFMGKKINEPPLPISEINTHSGPLVVQGQIFKEKVKGIRNDRFIISYLITDYHQSTCVKIIAGKDRWMELTTYLKEGDWIKVKGKVEYDNFEGADVIIAKDIEKVYVEARTCRAPNKRVELHAHTKMSAMDGLADVGDLISTAASLGHKALAITDHGVVQSFPEAAKHVSSKGLNIKIIYGLEAYLVDDENSGENFDYKKAQTYHIIILVKNQKGLKNLYKLVSESHLNYFYRRPRIPKSLLRSLRDGLIIGSACEAGEIYQGILNKLTEKEMKKLASLYDYLEIQPLINNNFLIEQGKVKDLEELKELNCRIVNLGAKCNIPVVATCDVHYTDEKDAIYRKIIMAGQGYKDTEGEQGLFLRTTDEMLEEFSYLGEDLAREIVIDNTNAIADTIEQVAPVPAESYRPEIANADKDLRETCTDRAEKIYGRPLPKIVANRLERELDSVIGNGYAVLYISSKILVDRSLSSGYLVGSRGSVGSSFAATMAGITEVNPLPAHYICKNPQCKNSEFAIDGIYDCGVDLPDKACPKCGEAYGKDGFNIPFETFMGFKGNKEPDIDLNFAGEYQSEAHKHVEDIFGSENVFRAGTIGTIAGKTAFGFVKKYFEGKKENVSKWEIERLTMGCTGVRRTTGQHPGGIVILPKGHEIYEFCPIQKPANDVETKVITTHYDYHSIDKNLLKLDILGHDVPSMLRMLEDITGVDPLCIPLRDQKVDSIFNGVEGLDIKRQAYPLSHGTYGIPEFGTFFVRQMLDAIKPTYFSDLIRISGLSHGTDVWINNAQNVIRDGHAIFQEVICTRDDIMNDLIAKGLPAKRAFNIMEKVRKGFGVTDDEAQIMRENNVPQWYIDSCKKIGYMFPKAHAVAYVIMSYRIAYYKVYYPLAFYATFFTAKVGDFNGEIIMGGYEKIWMRITEIQNKGKMASQKETDELTVLEVALEMMARGFEFANVDFGKSEAARFTVIDGYLRLPFRSISGVGEKAAFNIAEAVSKGPFMSVDDLRQRSKLNKTALEALHKMGVLKGLPESDQLTLF